MLRALNFGINQTWDVLGALLLPVVLHALKFPRPVGGYWDRPIVWTLSELQLAQIIHLRILFLKLVLVNDNNPAMNIVIWLHILRPVNAEIHGKFKGSLIFSLNLPLQN